MSWNYRVVRRERFGEDAFGIHEAYYDHDKRVWAITVNAVEPYGDTLVELHDSLVRMLRALSRPVLDHDAIPEKGAVAPGGSSYIRTESRKIVDETLDDLKQRDLKEKKARKQRPWWNLFRWIGVRDGDLD